jgi:hypothetical protein
MCAEKEEKEEDEMRHYQMVEWIQKASSACSKKKN